MKTAAASACCCHCLCPIKLCTIMQLIIEFNLYSLHHDISTRNSILSITINYIFAELILFLSIFKVVMCLYIFSFENLAPEPNFKIFYCKSRQVNFPTDLFVGKDGRR